jgi:DNA primase
MELLALLLEAPEIVQRQGELLAALPLSDRSLDRLRDELLNLAASGFRLETGRLEDHLVRAGMAELVERLNARRAKGGLGADAARDEAPEGADLEGIEARWLAAAVQLREIAEIDPERRQAMERFKSEANEETWRGAHRLLISRGHPND